MEYVKICKLRMSKRNKFMRIMECILYTIDNLYNVIFCETSLYNNKSDIAKVYDRKFTELIV